MTKRENIREEKSCVVREYDADFDWRDWHDIYE